MIDSKDFQGMGNLTELILSDNHIEVIEESAFASMPKLITLDISHNPIVSWNPHAFQVYFSWLVLLNSALITYTFIVLFSINYKQAHTEKICKLTSQAKIFSNYLLSYTAHSTLPLYFITTFRI